ncbi:hypothetical protein PF005_g19060 [Phytophthora fragariae]|uniref:Uncharacterized protein n=2 Tax=Phytophthora fragariae TaxID=53985 RepID=A0A6A4DFK5_9STRA|nr:hypothetical protein PF009_g20011 [Phytophthora fragariae]KAE9105602.1 hypothetical protein PF006_g21601 [Phytophthora fragariae]KAE9190907.1 hypothetical protein PF005_g19060 [Phytophthora fragariae]KAE9205329.1 hypothetical protein PF002_g20362 [Phytophthora fragariae]KAE9306353.1 hypothetical protein PF001_g12168 [Phytophthora fragariae]
MIRVVYKWDLLSEIEPPAALKEFQGLEFCCARVTHTDPYRSCRICEGSDHVMVERRLRCGSCTCTMYGSCLYTWKIWVLNDAACSTRYYNQPYENVCNGDHEMVAKFANNIKATSNVLIDEARELMDKYVHEYLAFLDDNQKPYPSAATMGRNVAMDGPNGEQWHPTKLQTFKVKLKMMVNMYNENTFM